LKPTKYRWALRYHRWALRYLTSCCVRTNFGRPKNDIQANFALILNYFSKEEEEDEESEGNVLFCSSFPVAKITSKPLANASGFDYILAPPSRVLVSQHRPYASGLIP
jgi:hypothetical protein